MTQKNQDLFSPDLAAHLWLCLTILLFFAGTVKPVTGQEFQPPELRPPGSSTCLNPAEIDPFAPDILQYLSFDSGPYHQQAINAMRDSLYMEAAQLYLYILHRSPEDLLAIYNLACCYSRLGRADLAAAFLLGAVRSGYDHYDDILNDPDFLPAAGEPAMQAALDEIRVRQMTRGEEIYIRSEKLIRCLVLPPPGKPMVSGRTVLICLHGYGSTPDTYRTVRQMLGDAPVVLVAPEGPYLYGSPAAQLRSWFSWDLRTEDQELWHEADSLSVDYIMDVVHMVREKYDPEKIFIFGFSQGAAYAYYAAIKNPGSFAGIVAVAGIFPDTDLAFSLFSEEEIRNAVHLPVLVAHGIQDRPDIIEKSRRASTRLQTYGYSVSYLPFSGGHELSGELMHRIVDWTKRVDVAK